MIKLKIINNLREGKKKIRKEKELTNKIILKVVEKVRLRKKIKKIKNIK